MPRTQQRPRLEKLSVDGRFKSGSGPAKSMVCFVPSTDIEGWVRVGKVVVSPRCPVAGLPAADLFLCDSSMTVFAQD
jgi:hypothetical protein